MREIWYKKICIRASLNLWQAYMKQRRQMRNLYARRPCS